VFLRDWRSLNDIENWKTKDPSVRLANLQSLKILAKINKVYTKKVKLKPDFTETQKYWTGPGQIYFFFPLMGGFLTLLVFGGSALSSALAGNVPS
jgi:hypothetical protein